MRPIDKIHIGTSGWHYDHWRGPFYPAGVPKKRFLEYYAGHFLTAEINNTFYKLPKKETFAVWRDNTPREFVFSVKAGRYITHMKKLKDPDSSVPRFLETIHVLGEKLGPILFQLPPRWGLDGERFEGFLRYLPRSYRYVFEFRDPSWFDPRVYEMMSEHGAAFCIYELAGKVSPKQVTGDFVYLRLHGPEGAYEGQYDQSVLSNWAEAFLAWAAQGKEIFCYFDNDQAGYAAQDGLRLKRLIQGN